MYTTPWLKFSHQEYPVAIGNCFKDYLSPLLAHIISSAIWLSLISSLWNCYIFLFYAQARLLFLHRQEQNHSLIFVLPACLRISFQTQGVVIEFSHLLLSYCGDRFVSNSPLYVHWHSISPGVFPENYLCDQGVIAELPSCIRVTCFRPYVQNYNASG